MELFLTALNALGVTNDELIKLASETGFSKREGGKIDPIDFVSTLCETSVLGGASCNDIGARLNLRNSASISKQAVWLRLNNSCKEFTERILALIITAKTGSDTPHFSSKCSRYNRILIQDSTIIKLPSRLFDEFSGVSNGKSVVCNARIQVVYDIISCEFLTFKIEKYSKNDLVAAPELQLEQNDLVLRDRGYLTLNEVERHVSRGADCIYRHKHNTTYFDPKTGKKICLLSLLRKYQSIDMEVCLNNDTKTKVRLIAAPVNEETANIRKMKLKRDQRGHSPSKGQLAMASWTVFITTIPQDCATFDEILEIYGLRWRIEIVFKAWKSHMNFSTLNNVPAPKLLILINARIIMITLLNNCVFNRAILRVKTYYNKTLSMIKFTKVMTTQIPRIVESIKVLNTTTGKHPAIEYLSSFCAYDKRTRLNYEDIKEQLLCKTLA